MEGCTILGALSVTSGVTDSITVVHGPAGCAQHNFSLLHATLLAGEEAALPHLVSTRLSEEDIIFGGEGALERALQEAAERDVGMIFVLNTCIADTIGDDSLAVCRRNWRVPVIYLPSAGFLGGGFTQGLQYALGTLAARAPVREKIPCTVNLIGEKNLEYEVDENHAEVARLLSLLDVQVHLRFVRKISTAALDQLGEANLNILREPDLIPIGLRLHQQFNTPFLPSFPLGLKGTLTFLQAVANSIGLDGKDVLMEEEDRQQRMLDRFDDFPEVAIRFDRTPDPVVEEVVSRLEFHQDPAGKLVPVPVPSPVGTKGVERMLHRWRRALHAAV
jgi:nitrogenase molybdenum-iron protein alpha/beta subunit